MNTDEAAIRLIGDTAVKAAGEEVVCPNAEPEHVYWLRQERGGPLVRQEAAPAPRKHEVFSIEDLANAMAELQKGGGDGRAMCFVGQGQITMLLDVKTRRDRVTMSLQRSRAFEALSTLQYTTEWFDQKGFLDLLQVVLADCIAPDVPLVIGNLKFTTQQDGEAAVDAGRETVGRTVKMRLAAGGSESKIPSDLLVSTPVYESLTEAQEMRCLLRTNIAEAQFRLVPIGKDLLESQQRADEEIRQMVLTALKSAGVESVSVVCGRA